MHGGDKRCHTGGRTRHTQARVCRCSAALQFYSCAAAYYAVAHLQEAAVVQEAAHAGDDGGAGAEDVLHLGVDNQVEVALAVPRLLREREGRGRGLGGSPSEQARAGGGHDRGGRAGASAAAQPVRQGPALWRGRQMLPARRVRGPCCAPRCRSCLQAPPTNRPHNRLASAPAALLNECCFFCFLNLDPHLVLQPKVASRGHVQAGRQHLGRAGRQQKRQVAQARDRTASDAACRRCSCCSAVCPDRPTHATPNCRLCGRMGSAPSAPAGSAYTHPHTAYPCAATPTHLQALREDGQLAALGLAG